MTCIVGLIDKGKVYMGADSAGVEGYSLLTRKDSKVIKINNSIIMGCTSSFRMIQLLRYKLKVPPLPSIKDTFKWSCTEFIDNVKKMFKENDYTAGKFLLGLNGQLFQISEDFQVGEHMLPYDSVGCGAAYALGSLYSDKSKHPKKRILNALEASDKFSAGVCKPFYIESI